MRRREYHQPASTPSLARVDAKEGLPLDAATPLHYEPAIQRAKFARRHARMSPPPASKDPMKAHTVETQATMTPEKAVHFLREGNERFVNNLRAKRDLLAQVNDTRDGQFPFATVLSCIDSRTSAELIFDQGLGDIFSVRIAGSIINDDILGSMEFACKVAGSKAVIVLGHTKCGAIKGACDHVQLGNVSTLLNKIEPSIYAERETKENRTSKNAEFVERVSEIQVRRSVLQIVEHSMVLRSMIEEKQIQLIGALYDVESGKVRWLDDAACFGELGQNASLL
jgi:carbonic anhydrase